VERTYTIPAKPKKDDEHLELIARIIFIIGFRYDIVEQRWPQIKKAFHNFNIAWVAKATPEKILHKPGVINNKRKIVTIIENAQECVKIIKEHGSMAAWAKNTFQQNKKDPIFSTSLADECQQRFKGIGETTKNWLSYVFAEGKSKPETRVVESS